MKNKICSPTKLILGALVATTFALPIHLQAADGILEPASLVDRVKKEVAKISIGKEVNIVEAGIYEGLSTALSYRIQSEPSYIDGYYTRLDRYRLRVDLVPGDLIDDDNTPFGFDIRKDVEVIFARQFKSQKQSLTAIPYTFKNFPLTADRAIRRMNVGDFVAFQTNLSLVLSVGTFPELSGTVGLGASTHAFISGEFMIHFYKMPNNHIRMKMIAIRSKGVGVDGRVELIPGVKIIGFKWANNRIKDLVDVEPFKAETGKNQHDLFMIDYVFDLNDPSAAQAFTNVVKNKLRFKDVEISNPLSGDNKLRDAIITDISSAEKIVADDKALKPTERRIHRVFKGSNSLTSTGARMKIGISLAKYERGFGFGQNKIINTDLNEVQNYYLMDIYSLFSKSKLLFGLYGDENIDNTTLMYGANQDFTPDKFISLVLTHEAKMRSMSDDDYNEIRRHVQLMLPARLYSQIDWKHWSFGKGSLPNGYFKEEIFMEPQAMAAITARDQRGIVKTYTDYLLHMGNPKSMPRYGIPLDPRRFIGPDWIEVYRDDIQEIAKNLDIIFDSANSSQKRYDAYYKLKGIPLYRETIAGYLISLLPPNDIERLLTYKLTVSAKGVDTVYQEFGKFEDYDLYESLVYIQTVVTSRSYDLRLLIGKDGEITPKAAAEYDGSDLQPQVP
ncbi:MAG: hypothetical protein JSU04_06565 [Bdellovibrionales bacterium]|nr:hypothetical protein [Bdellovibrionales bacterium]